jgi:hypothetical protein
MKRFATIAVMAVVAACGTWWWSCVDTSRVAMPSADSNAIAKGEHPDLHPGMPMQSIPTSKAGSSPARLRRLLATRLGLPRTLRLQHLHTVRSGPYAGVTCGHVAWGRTAASATVFKRFVATRHNVLIEGRTDVDKAWALACRTR